MKKLLKEPLLHFLVAGLALFVLYEIVADDVRDTDSRLIVVDREAMLTFVQFRTRAFEPGAAAERLDAMSPDELERLIDDYVREEALHREALALGVDKNDYVIKRRMIQSIEFITDGFVTAAVDVTDDDVQQYFEANREDYFIDPFVTFTHVYFRLDDRDRESVEQLARAKLEELNADAAPFGDAPRHGDRFPYFVNYVERNPEFVASHFGQAMADRVFALEPDDSAWHGPLESPHGFHIVMLTRKSAGRYPALEEIADAVRSDTERDLSSKRQDEAIQAIVDAYEVRRNL